jgi:alpha-mannosidase
MFVSLSHRFLRFRSYPRLLVTSQPNRYYTLDSADLVVPYMPAWHLMWSFNLLVQIAQNDQANSPLSERAMNAANEIINVFEAEDSDRTIALANKIAERLLGDGWQDEAEKVWEKGGKKAEGEAKLWSLGHW